MRLAIDHLKLAMKSTIDSAVLIPAAESLAPSAPVIPSAKPEKTKVKGGVDVKKAKPAKAAKPDSGRVAEIRAAAEVLALVKNLGVEIKPFETNPNSFVLRLPLFKDAVKALPKSDDAKTALQILRGLTDSVSVLCGDASKTWVFHKSGSFALYSRLP